MENKGYTVIFTRWDDGKEVVAGRFRTEQEKDKFLKEIRQPGSGWLAEEKESIYIMNDYNYMLQK